MSNKEKPYTFNKCAVFLFIELCVLVDLMYMSGFKRSLSKCLEKSVPSSWAVDMHLTDYLTYG